MIAVSATSRARGSNPILRLYLLSVFSVGTSWPPIRTLLRDPADIDERVLGCHEYQGYSVPQRLCLLEEINFGRDRQHCLHSKGFFFLQSLVPSLLRLDCCFVGSHMTFTGDIIGIYQQ